MSRIFSQNYFLTAGECNAEGRMPLTLLTARLIECATKHANTLGIGYSDLIKIDLAWVLSRVSIEIVEMPGINADYIVNTWIESSNRMFSERCYSVTDAEGRIFVHARTTWAAICITSRRPSNLAVLGDVLFPTDSPECPVAPPRRTLPLHPEDIKDKYTFSYCDIDFNRHVNTIRYLDVILNVWDLAHYDTFEIARFDVAFHKECHFGDTIEIRIATDADLLRSTCELVHEDARVVSSNIAWRRKEFK